MKIYFKIYNHIFHVYYPIKIEKRITNKFNATVCQKNLCTLRKLKKKFSINSLISNINNQVFYFFQTQFYKHIYFVNIINKKIYSNEHILI